MKRKCPICDTRSDVYLSKCGTCGYVFSSDESDDSSHVVRLDSHSPRRHTKLAGVVAALAVSVVVIVVVLLFVFGGSQGSPELSATLTHTVTLYTYSHFTVVIVQLTGWITNYGDVTSTALVQIEVFDGSNWLSYDVRTGEIPKEGGMLWFQWSQDYTNADEEGFDVRYEVTAI